MTPNTELIIQRLVQATLALATAAVVVSVLVRAAKLRSARTEQVLWLLVLLQGAALVPFVIELPGGGQWPPGSLVFLQGRTGTAGPSPHAVPLEKHPSSPQPADGRWQHWQETVSPLESTPDTPRHRAGQIRSSWSWPAAVLVGWLVGIIARVLLGTYRYAAFLSRVAQARPAPSDWSAEWHLLLAEHGIRRNIPLLVHPEAGPVICCTPRGYRLVVPEPMWRNLSAEERPAILRHELAHYRHGDLWSALVSRLLAVVHWFNPCAWWAVRRVEMCAEFACDAAVARHCDAAAYAGVLIQLGSCRAGTTSLVHAVRSNQLYQRVRRLLTDSGRNDSLSKRVLLVTTAMVLLAGGSLRVRFVAGGEDKGDSLLAAPTQATAIQPVTDAIADERQDDVPNPRSLPQRALIELGTRAFRTRNSVHELAFSPDGRWIAVTAINELYPIVYIFDTASGREVKRLISPDPIRGWADAIAFSPDGSRLVAGDISGRVSMWDVVSAKLLFCEQLHHGQVCDVAFAPNGKTFASSGLDGVVQVRKNEDPNELIRKLITAELPDENGRTSVVTHRAAPVAFTPDGTRIVAGMLGTIIVWQIDSGKELRRIENAHGVPAGLNAGRGGGGGVPKTALKHASSPALNGLAVTPDGRRILSCSSRVVPIGETKLKHGPKNIPVTEFFFWDINTGQRVLSMLDDETDYGFGYATLSPDGRFVASGDFSKLRIWDATSGRLVRIISLPGWWGRRPAFSPDGKVIAVPYDNAAAMFELETGRRLHHRDRTPVGMVLSAAWSPNGSRAATGNSDGYVRVWDVKTGDLLWSQPLAPVINITGWKANPKGLAFSSDGRWLVVGGRRDTSNWLDTGLVAVYEAETGRLVREIPLPADVWHMSLSPDGKHAVAATTNGSIHDTRVHVLDLDTGQEQVQIPAPEERLGLWSVEASLIAADGRSLSVATGDSHVLHFDATTGKEQSRFRADWRSNEQREAAKSSNLQISDAVFDAQMRRFVSAANSSIHVWNSETGSHQAVMEEAGMDETAVEEAGVVAAAEGAHLRSDRPECSQPVSPQEHNIAWPGGLE